MKTNFKSILSIAGLLLVAGALGCSQKPVEGPDKTFQGEALGALEGAGAGAVTGFQVGAGAGPGAAVGAGLGAIVGAIRGISQDNIEENDIRIAHQVQDQRKIGLAQEALADHYKRRMELHPTRDIFPADLFFRGDSTKVCSSGVQILREIAKMNEFRLPYSRLIVAVYIKATDPESPYAVHLSEQRSRALVDQLVRAGVEPRRLQTRAVVVDAPLLIDPLDDPSRYNQAVEIIPADR
jgi:outer membrane protein OmpA-like peptidoglycan-associated protein